MIGDRFARVGRERKRSFGKRKVNSPHGCGEPSAQPKEVKKLLMFA
jgi:hypothetical protein